jgi:hypothetical protein
MGQNGAVSAGSALRDSSSAIEIPKKGYYLASTEKALVVTKKDLPLQRYSLDFILIGKAAFA